MLIITKRYIEMQVELRISKDRKTTSTYKDYQFDDHKVKGSRTLFCSIYKMDE